MRSLYKKLWISFRIRTREFPLQRVFDLEVPADESWAIPNTCYQTWVNNKFGRTHSKEISNFRSLNPEISWILFDDVQMHNYMKKQWNKHPIYEIFERSNFGPMKADIFRYCILFERGGYYFDISKSCTMPLRQLHDRDSMGVISFENNKSLKPVENETRHLLKYPDNLIIQWGLGFTSEHPFLKKVISLIVEKADFYRGKVLQNPKDAILELTGPRAFTEAVILSATPESFKKISQCDIDFFGTGHYALRGSYVRFFTRKHYTDYENSIILS